MCLISKNKPDRKESGSILLFVPIEDNSLHAVVKVECRGVLDKVNRSPTLLH